MLVKKLGKFNKKLANILRKKRITICQEAECGALLELSQATHIHTRPAYSNGNIASGDPDMVTYCAFCPECGIQLFLGSIKIPGAKTYEHYLVAPEDNKIIEEILEFRI